MKNYLLILACILTASCGAARLATPKPSDVSKMENTYPALTLEQLNQGKADFEANCNRCHWYKNPVKRTEEQWKKIVPIMAKKAEKKYGKEIIDRSTQESILKYLITMTTVYNKKKS